MTLVGVKAKNHAQQVAAHGVDDAVDDRGTPWSLFNELHERFGFTVDVAAAPHNAKLPCFYTRENSGLTASWKGERVWCNPPYSSPNLSLFVEKAWSEWHHEGAELIVMLVPANRPEQAWWQDHVEPHRDRPDSPLKVEFLRDRRRFIRHDLGHTEVMPNERPPFGVCLLIWSQEAALCSDGRPIHDFQGQSRCPACGFTGITTAALSSRSIRGDDAG